MTEQVLVSSWLLSDVINRRDVAHSGYDSEHYYYALANRPSNLAAICASLYHTICTL